MKNVYDVTKRAPNPSWIVTGTVINCPYSGKKQELILPVGEYLFEVWGAEGGQGVDDNGYKASPGKGGYSSGKIKFTEETAVWLHTGGQGGRGATAAQAAPIKGGYNGGGDSSYNGNSNYGHGGGSGGGASDIRISMNSMFARVIVAGGGGGSGSSWNYTANGGYGGGTMGGGGVKGLSWTVDNAGGGAQTAGGEAQQRPNSGNTGAGSSGTFGYGGSGYAGNYYAAGGGGGGGWYGGGAGVNGNSAGSQGGGGGSGWVYTQANQSKTPLGWQLDKGYWLTEAQTLNGAQSFSDPNGNTETGHSGNGYIRITKLGSATWDFPYSGTYQSVALPKGQYKLECWGAQGGSYSSTDAYSGGKGGYASGILNLDKATTLYVFTGGAGTYYTTSTYTSTGGGGYNGGGGAGYRGGGGGGASDIRIGSTSLYARVIVAGGGGGSYYYSATYRGKGGAGGGLKGEDGKRYSTSYVSYGGGGTQTAGGTRGVCNSSSYYGTAGSFGQGGSTGYKYNSTSYYSSGAGGGGWYGGGGGGNYSSSSRAYNAGGGGGSGYVYTEDSAVNYPTGCLLNKEYYLIDEILLDGTNTFNSPTGEKEVGHSSNGYVRISLANDNPHEEDDYIYEDVSFQPSYNKNIDDKNQKYEFNYTGGYQSITLPQGGYKLECWGAQGGHGRTGYGGKGGYSTGIITIPSSTTLYVYVGGQGTSDSNNVSGTYSGGFNGGGSSYGGNGGRGAGGGGTDIRIGSTSLYARAIVAGGGGGGFYYSGTSYSGGVGGGETGSAGSHYGSETPGQGGTQMNGGSSSYVAGAFGEGGSYSGTSTISGGGGGWYGGGGGNAGGGGSGYVYTETTAVNYPFGCLLNSSYYLTEAETITGNQTFLSPTGEEEVGHEGNGYVRITELKPFPTNSATDLGNAISPNGASIFLGKTTSADRQAIDKLREESYQPYNITMLDQWSTDMIPASSIPIEMPKDQSLSGNTVQDVLPQLEYRIVTAIPRFTIEAKTAEAYDLSEITLNNSYTSSAQVFYNGILMNANQQYTLKDNKITLIGFTTYEGDIITVVGPASPVRD